MMSIAWIILGYLMIGAAVSYSYGKLAKWRLDDGDYVLIVYIWPIILLYMVLIRIPEKTIEYIREKREEKEREKRRRQLKENCANCARNNSESCPEGLRPLTSSCYDKPREEKKNDQTK